ALWVAWFGGLLGRGGAVGKGRVATHWALAGGAVALGVAIAVVVSRMSPPGAAVFGWPLVWSIPLFPLRALGLLRERVAFDVSIALSLLAVAGTVVCTAVIGRAATGRRWVGLGAATLCAVWPLLTRPLAGRHASHHP